MYICYFDESGDDGLPGSSPLFVLSSLYLHHQTWKETYASIHEFRTRMKEAYGIPIQTEMHTKRFLLNKKEYRSLSLDDQARIQVCKDFAAFIGSLNFKSIHVVINKQNVAKGADYDVLSNALTYNIQRIENDLIHMDPTTKFLTITDEGRVGKMRKTTRKIQRINFIPSQYGRAAYRKEIQLMIEDPLPKNSKESYWIQIADFIAYFVYLFESRNAGIPWPNRLQLPQTDFEEIINGLEPIFNRKASSHHPFGFVVYPR